MSNPNERHFLTASVGWPSAFLGSFRPQGPHKGLRFQRGREIPVTVSPLPRFDGVTEFRQGERYVKPNHRQTSQKVSHRILFKTITFREYTMGISTTEMTRVSLIITILPVFLHPAGGNLYPLRQMTTPMSRPNADAAGMKSHYTSASIIATK